MVEAIGRGGEPQPVKVTPSPEGRKALGDTSTVAHGAISTTSRPDIANPPPFDHSATNLTTAAKGSLLARVVDLVLRFFGLRKAVKQAEALQAGKIKSEIVEELHPFKQLLWLKVDTKVLRIYSNNRIMLPSILLPETWVVGFPPKPRIVRSWQH